MTPRQRAQLIAAAKNIAVPVHSCVAANLRPDHLLAARTREELMAVVIVLAEAADPVRLRAVTLAPGDEGMPVIDRVAALRAGHSEYVRLHRAGSEVPLRVRLAEREYRQENKRRLEAAAREGERAA